MFEKVEELLTTVSDELDSANSLLYAIATEALDINDKVTALNDKVDKIISAPLDVTFDYEKLADAIIMALGYTATQGEKAAEIAFAPHKKVK